MSYTLALVGSTFRVTTPTGSYTDYSTAQAALSAFLSAIPASGFGNILVGNYLQTAGVSGSRTSVTISGDTTAILKMNALLSTGYPFAWTGSTFKLSNITFDGGRTTAWPDTTGTDASPKGNSPGPRINTNHVVVDGITIQNTKRNAPTKGADGLNIGGSSGAPVTDYEVLNSHFKNIYGSGIAAAYLDYLNVHDSDFMDCAQWYPIGGAIYAGDGVSHVTLGPNLTISGHTDNDGIYVGTSRSLTVNALITRCTINLMLYDKGGGDYDPANPQSYAGSGIKLYGSGEISYSDINWNNSHWGSNPCYTGCISLWGSGVNVIGNTLRNARYGVASWLGVVSTGNHTIQSNLFLGLTIAVNLEQSGTNVVANKFMSNGTDIQGTPNIHTDNLYDKTASDRRKLTTSSNINSPLIMQGFEIAVNEICYTEQGSVILIGAKATAGYAISKFRINGIDYTPDANGLYSLTVGAMDYTIVAILVASGTYPLTYASQPKSVVATINGVAVPSGSVAQIPIGSTITIQVPDPG